LAQVFVQFYKIETWQQFLAKAENIDEILAQLTIFVQCDDYDYYFYHTDWYNNSR